tara:strand:- start:72 stop:290 length:219 start_codon:yes stop_codon:yes gene_type:complete
MKFLKNGCCSVEEDDEDELELELDSARAELFDAPEDAAFFFCAPPPLAFASLYFLNKSPFSKQSLVSTPCRV